MRRASLLLALALAGLGAQPLNQRDREFALSHLHATRKLFLDSIDGLSEAQWKFKPGPDRWSIAECAEHVALSEDFMFRRVEAMLKSPPAGDRKAAVKDEQALGWMRDRSQKAKNSSATQPAGRWASPAQLSRYFKERRDQTLDYVRTTQDALRSYFDGTGAKALDACQWLLLIAGHTERHVAQINETKSDPSFPE